MDRRLSPLGIFLKWLVAPAVLGLLGYFLLGPAIVHRYAPDSDDKPFKQANPDNEPDNGSHKSSASVARRRGAPRHNRAAPPTPLSDDNPG
ncbi:MAG: hypothetical protein JSS72_03165 [Armatimonadetes bacterium]|nr:hypothetical protein [Armatimonadota bacterium]